MKGLVRSLVACWAVAGTACAYAQSYYGQDDPCQPPRYSGPFGALLSAGAQQQRRQACLDERKAQWDSYNARQQEQQRQADAAKEEQRQRALEQEAALQKQQQEELAARRMFYRRLVLAEQSPANHCHEPDVARRLIDDFNGLDGVKDDGIKIVDIEHLTTVAYDDGTGAMTCHGIFITSRNSPRVGSLQYRKNVAGDELVAWHADDSQDLSIYERPPGLTDSGNPLEKPVEPLPKVSDAVSAQIPLEVPSDLQSQPSFIAGQTDRRIWETWFSALEGEKKEGAQWWASNRSLRNHPTCADVSANRVAWLAGCNEAQAMLTSFDEHRKADAIYKKGWNAL